MASLDLRPLSLGEILERTFSLYRRYFFLFVGIAAIPQIAVLAVGLIRTYSRPTLGSPFVDQFQFRPYVGSGFGVLYLVLIVVSLIAYVFSQGGTVVAVSELYLGRSPLIAKSFREVSSDIASLIGVVFLNALAVLGASLLLIIPGIYVACRLIVCIPAAVVERRGPRDSLSRSFELTRGNAGRAFVIFILYVVLAIAITVFLAFPFTFAATVLARTPESVRFWSAMAQVGQSVTDVLVDPILLIATAIFYFDLRVRKENFNLESMPDERSQRI